MKCAVIGSGSWGSALASVLARQGHQVHMWARRSEIAREIQFQHTNASYLPDVALPSSIQASCNLDEVVCDAQLVLVVTPSQVMRSISQQLAACITPSMHVVLCFKGIDYKTGKTPDEVFSEALVHHSRLAVLSGPNHAEEIVRDIPCATVVASYDAACAQFVQHALSSPRFRVYTSRDVKGVEVCGAYKNIIAIAVGISYGVGCGDNTAALLMTRGLAEMSRFVYYAQGDPRTCTGLAGTGDLIATCMSQHSRNRRFGEALAAGMSLDEFREKTHMVVEGALACKNVKLLCERYQLDLPIAQKVQELVWEGAKPLDVAAELLQRPLKEEFIDKPSMR